MSFEGFVEGMKEEVARRLGEGYQVTVRKVDKNNGGVLTGLCIGVKEAPVSAAVYLEYFYDRYLQGGEGNGMEVLADEAVRMYEEQKQQEQSLYAKADEFSDYQKVKERIVLKLINTKENEALLRGIPGVPFLDLTAVFYIWVDEDETGIMTALVHDEHMEMWGVDIDTLYETAKENMRTGMPVHVRSIGDIFGIKAGEDSMADCVGPCPFHVLTTESGIYGAAALLYTDQIEKMAGENERDIIILPSSVHELLLLVDDGSYDYHELSLMVRGINESVVEREDRLSSCVYLYSWMHKQTVIIGC